MTVLKCMIVYLAQDIPAFVMYCVYGESRSSLAIESSTDSMITSFQNVLIIIAVHIKPCSPQIVAHNFHYSIFRSDKC